MDIIFDIILNMAITSSVVIFIIILVRFILKGVPKKYSYILWSIAGFRLCCPFSFKSVISLFNINPIQRPNEIVTNSGRMNYLDAPIYLQTPQTDTDVIGGADVSVSTLVIDHTFSDFIPYIWIIGIIILLIYGSISYIRTRREVSTATKKKDNIFECENITTPFILGIIKPKIYVPYSIDKDYFDYVIAHEKYHLKRKDNVVKLFAFLLLCIYWFNPFCWIAFYLMNKDMEMSCDEWVLAHSTGIKKAYSNALLSFATAKSFPNPSPLSFGEGSAKSRIKNVLKYKKPTVIISIIAILLCITVTVVCIANPLDNKEEVLPNQDTSNLIHNDINEQLNENTVYSVGDSMFLALEQSFDLSAVQSVEIKDNKVNIHTNENTFYGKITRTENMEGSEFFNYWNKLGLIDVSPFDTTVYYNIEIKYICEDINSYDAEYILYYFDDELMLIGFVYQDETGNDIIKGINEIKNDAVYMQQIISRSEAIKIAYEKLNEDYSPERRFRYDLIELNGKTKQFCAFNTKYIPNTSGHPYYGVSFLDTDTISDFYYYCIDAITGELIYSGMMGD